MPACARSGASTSNQYGDLLCSVASTWNLCPGATTVNASLTCGAVFPGPSGEVTMAVKTKSNERPTAICACCTFSPSRSSRLLFTESYKSLFAMRTSSNSKLRIALESGTAAPPESDSLLSAACFNSAAIDSNSLRSHGTFLSSSPNRDASPGSVVSIPSKKSCSCPSLSFGESTTESTSL